MPTNVILEHQPPSFAQRMGATPGKLIIVGVLAVVFVGVVVNELISPPSETALAPRPKTQTKAKHAKAQSNARSKIKAPARSKSQSTLASNDKAPSRQTTLSWPEISLEEVIQHNAFALPPNLRPAPNKEESGGVEENADGAAPLDSTNLASEKPKDSPNIQDKPTVDPTSFNLALVVIGDRDRAAVIGGRTVRIGDRIGGLRVMEITHAGVVVTRENP